ncbi:hypothetical protein [Stutzerimonas nosocomialis]|uniref:hypothetical protein n=1 Tax=Stutzerimonas nosocomialis TaxID=1056496 RepID=UPI001109C2CF|nr:hypothetical protein [Stutzerimonas nosocomialis]
MPLIERHAGRGTLFDRFDIPSPSAQDAVLKRMQEDSVVVQEDESLGPFHFPCFHLDAVDWLSRALQPSVVSACRPFFADLARHGASLTPGPFQGVLGTSQGIGNFAIGRQILPIARKSHGRNSAEFDFFSGLSIDGSPSQFEQPSES